MLPEFKKVEYFLKVQNCDDNINVHEILNTLNTIDNIATTYVVDTNKIKSKNNLIF